MEEASSQLCTHLQSIAGAARQVLEEQGVGYSATAQMTEMYFPTRDYGDFRLPAGRYRTLRVTLGEGAGKNWWCPPACACPPPPRRRPCSLCRRGSARWWRAARMSR